MGYYNTKGIEKEFNKLSNYIKKYGSINPNSQVLEIEKYNESIIYIPKLDDSDFELIGFLEKKIFIYNTNSTVVIDTSDRREDINYNIPNSNLKNFLKKTYSF